jgi:hypothetical protein
MHHHNKHPFLAHFPFTMPLAITVSQNLRLKVLLVFVWLSSVEPRKISRFLFVGQSNMEGNVVNDPGSLRFDQTMDILLSSGSDERIRNEMVEHLKTADILSANP